MIACRTARADDLATMLDWAAAEGWNPGLDDAAAFFAADPQGFFLATEDDAPVAAISVVNHSDAFAFLGLYLVRPDRRGRGIGLALWRHALDHAGGRCVGLDGVPDQQANYAASGFVHAGATTRFAGTVSPQDDPAIRPATDTEIPDLVAAEARASGTAKPRYLGAWFRPAATRQTFVDGTGAGFCTIRACRSGTKIGPLLAEDADTALRLMRHASARMPGPTMIDVPDAAPALDALCRDLGLAPGFHTARMYRGPAPTGQAALFAVTSLELG